MFRWMMNNEINGVKNKIRFVQEAPGDEGLSATDYSAAEAELDAADTPSDPNDGLGPTDYNETEGGGDTDTEAEGDDMEATDYTEAEDDTETDDTEAEDDTETDDTETDDETAEDDTETDDTEGGDEGDDMEATDYTEEGGDDTEGGDTEGDGDTTDDTTSDEAPSNEGDKTKNRFLIRDFIKLYFTVNNIIDKINNISKTDLLRNKIYMQVAKNLTEMNEVLYDYTTEKFSKNSYVFNMYEFNLFLECVKINTDMLKKSGELPNNN